MGEQPPSALQLSVRAAAEGGALSLTVHRREGQSRQQESLQEPSEQRTEHRGSSPRPRVYAAALLSTAGGAQP